MTVSLLSFDKFAVLPESINFGEAESREITKQVQGGGLYKIKAFRQNLSLSIQGVNDIEVAYYVGGAQRLSASEIQHSDRSNPYRGYNGCQPCKHLIEIV